MISRAIEISIEQGRILRVFTKDEAIALSEQWSNVFCKDKQGANTKAYMWHIFSFERYPSVSGAEALARYKQQAAPEYIVLSNNRFSAIATDTLPDVCNLSDFLVFPVNMAWTMAFTHEDGWLGPYFAVHSEYHSLNAKNLEQLRASTQKRKEIENARSNGWL